MESENIAIIISLIAIFINFLTILIALGVFDWFVDIVEDGFFYITEFVKKINKKKDTKN